MYNLENDPEILTYCFNSHQWLTILLVANIASPPNHRLVVGDTIEKYRKYRVLLWYRLLIDTNSGIEILLMITLRMRRSVMWPRGP